jgi:hypothetical protein
MDSPTLLYDGFDRQKVKGNSCMKFANFGAPESITIECCAESRVIADDLLSVVVLFDHPFDTKSASDALFSVAVQDHGHLDVVLVLPDLGSKFRGLMMNTLRAQPWPAGTRLRLTEVKALSSRAVSGYLMNAGMCQAEGRYIAFLHHQDLVYQHSYLRLIERLRMTPIAFGGVRRAIYTYGRRHLAVVSKELLRSWDPLPSGSQSAREAISAFVADRKQLLSEHLTVHQPEASSAAAKFLSRLATHSKVDLHFIDKPFFEIRTLRRPSVPANGDESPIIQTVRNSSGEPVSMPHLAKREAKIDYMRIPIFINSRDLFEPLRKLIYWLLEAGYSCLNIVDNDSTYPELLNFYDAVRADVRIIRLGFNAGHKAIWSTKILKHFEIEGPYVWTDPDVVPTEECPSNVVEYFYTVLQAFPYKTKVGFGLRIDDLPDDYPFKQQVITWESQFWTKRIANNLYDALIDTTFALYRAGSTYDMQGIRTGFPYVARHLPWYEISEKPSKDRVYYMQRARAGINSWSDQKLPDWLDAATRR